MVNIGNMMKQAQQLQKKMSEAQEKLNSIEVEGVSGGGLVKVTATAKGEIKRILLDESLLKKEDPETWSNIRIATKYPNITKKFFYNKGIQVEIIKLSGSMELAPSLNMCRRIVDLVSTGKTLKENGLTEIEEIMKIQSKLIVNRSAYKTNMNEVSKIISEIGTFVK